MTFHNSGLVQINGFSQESIIYNNFQLLLVTVYKYRYALFGIWFYIFGYMLVYYIIHLSNKLKELEKQLLLKEKKINNEFNILLNNRQTKLYNDINDILRELRDEISMNITQITTNLELLHEMIDKNDITNIETNLLEINEKIYINSKNIMELDEKTNAIPWGYYKGRDNSCVGMTLFGNEKKITSMTMVMNIYNKNYEITFYLD